MKNAVIYARYSSDRQNEMSIEGQLRECRSYAQKNDMLVIEEYIDRAQTATTDKRPNFLRMIQDSENRTFEVILVYQLDRFARNKNDSGYYKKILSNNGVRVISAKEQIASDSSGVITEGMLEIVADWFSKQLSEKVTRGMMQNAEKCKYNGGTMTFGYTVDNDGHYILDEQRAPIVKEIFERIANGETAASICADLNRRGIRTIKGNVFVKNSLQNMIRNEKYKGIYSFGGVRVPDGMPRIVSDELFDEVQDALEHRSSMTRPVSDNYLLTGKLYCGYCTKPMIGTSGTSKTGKVHRYYICQNTIGKVKKCDKRSVRKDFIESQVISICLASLTDDIIDTVVDSVVAQNNIDQESPELVRLRAEIKAIEKKIDELIDQVEAGVHSPRFARRLEEREAELETLKKQKRIEEHKQRRIDPELARSFLYSMKNGNFQRSMEYRKMLINLFIDKVYVFDDHLRVLFNYDKRSSASESQAKAIDKYFTEGSEPKDNGVPIRICNFNKNSHILFHCPKPCNIMPSGTSELSQI